MLRLPILLLASAALHAQVGRFDLHVTTTTHQPVAGASVTVQGPDNRTYSGVTASDGHFRIAELPAGVYKFQAFNAPGYIRYNKNFLADFSIHSGNERSIGFQLEPVRKIEGTVTDDRGNPIEGATVIAADPLGAPRALMRGSATTDSRGAYSLSLVPEPASFLDTFSLSIPVNVTVKAYVTPDRATQTGQAFYPSQAETVEIRSGSLTRNLALRPSPAFHIRGRVSTVPSAAEAPLVWIYSCNAPDDEGLTSTTTLRADGSFDAPGILPGSACVTLETIDPSTQAKRYSRVLTVAVSDRDVDQVQLSLP